MVTLSLSLERCLGLLWVGLVAHGADKLAAFCDCKGGAEGLNAALPPSVCVRTGLAGDLAVAQALNSGFSARGDRAVAEEGRAGAQALGPLGAGF